MALKATEEGILRVRSRYAASVPSLDCAPAVLPALPLTCEMQLFGESSPFGGPRQDHGIALREPPIGTRLSGSCGNWAETRPFRLGQSVKRPEVPPIAHGIAGHGGRASRSGIEQRRGLRASVVFWMLAVLDRGPAYRDSFGVVCAIE